ISDLPESVLCRVGPANRILLPLKQPVDSIKAALCWVIFWHHSVDLEDRVLGTVDLKVKSHIEDVLMDWRVEAVVVECLAVDRLRSWNLSSGREDARRLHQKLDAAVKIKVPVEAVLVVGHGRDE